MLRYSKYSGAGNTFLLFDNRFGEFPHEMTPSLCEEENCDGVILLENPTAGDFKMRIFNRDGSEAEMCGNGIRTFVKYLEELGYHQPTFQIETKAGLFSAQSLGSEVTVSMGMPHSIQWDLKVAVGDTSYTAQYINSGVPHLVLFVETLSSLDVEDLGSKLRTHPQFAPNGVNVDFVTPTAQGAIRVRTYERGVERETAACGTGAVASAIAAAKKWNLPSPIKVLVRSGDTLNIDFSQSDEGFENVRLTGPVEKISETAIPLSLK